MSGRNRGAAIAGGLLLMALIAALALRPSPRHGHPSATPPVGPVTTTTDLGTSGTGASPPESTPDPGTATTTTTPAAQTAASRRTGSYANGSPARLDVAIAAPLDPLPPPDAGWHPLTVVQGTGNGVYATFHISSATTQVRFRSSAADFHIFVVDQVQGREATAGYADVDCAGPCGDVMELSVPAGDYHVEVDADGPWELSLEEYAPPR